MSSPIASILIPVYNRKKYIAECINSALQQTVRDIEIVIVDNCSDDGTWEICQEFASRDARIRLFRNDKNIGPVRNWLRCFEEAKGVYGKLLFSDDMMGSKYLERTLPYLDNAQVGFVYTATIIGESKDAGILTYANTFQAGVHPSKKYIERAAILGDVPLSPGAAIFRMDDLRKNLMIEIPSPSYTDFAEHGAGPDLLLYLLAAHQYPYFAFVSEPLAFFRSHAGSITVREKSFIGTRYNQARIWFVNNIADESLQARLVLKAWLSDVVREKAIFPLSKTIRRYFIEKPDIPVYRLVVAVFSLAILTMTNAFGVLVLRRLVKKTDGK